MGRRAPQSYHRRAGACEDGVRVSEQMAHLSHCSPVLLPQYLRKLLRRLARFFEMTKEPALTCLGMALRNALNRPYGML